MNFICHIYNTFLYYCVVITDIVGPSIKAAEHKFEAGNYRKRYLCARQKVKVF